MDRSLALTYLLMMGVAGLAMIFSIAPDMPPRGKKVCFIIAGLFAVPVLARLWILGVMG
jgi:hypothetical protein